VSQKRRKDDRPRHGIRTPHVLAGALTLVAALAVALRAPEGDARELALPDVAAVARAPLRFATPLDAQRFYKGNIHAHSAMTDGDSPAEMVFAWYRDHGYHFLALTDHNRLLDPSRYRHVETDDFRLLPGEEVTLAAAGQPVHVNAICTQRTIGGANFESVASALQWAIDRVADQRGIAMINHPNFHYALDIEDMQRVRGAQLLDVYNGHPMVRSDGDETHLSVEAMWEMLLTSGSTIAPAAVDDMHMLRDEPTDDRVPHARPGTGWVEVMAAELTRPAICQALAEGKLVASNGPHLERLQVTDDRLSLWIEDPGALVEFFGSGGERLASAALQVDDEYGMYASYQLRGDEIYVRARVTTSLGRAWTNAYRTTR
jgi:hypothetical protein